MSRYGPLTEALRAKVMGRIEFVGDCWLWKGSLQGRYPRVWVPGVGDALVHVLLYEDSYGPVDAGLQIAHVECYDRLCVNPDHKMVKTCSANVLDADVMRTGTSEQFVCGHPRTPENTLRQGAVGTRCRICAAERQRARRRRCA